MSKHTPAPWAVQKAEDCMGRKLDEMVRWVITADDHNLFISTGPTWDPEHAEESEANARMIVAAPDSHDANIMFVQSIERFCGIKPDWDDECIYDEMPSSELAAAYFAARAAIAKATGK